MKLVTMNNFVHEGVIDESVEPETVDVLDDAFPLFIDGAQRGIQMGIDGVQGQMIQVLSAFEHER